MLLGKGAHSALDSCSNVKLLKLVIKGTHAKAKKKKNMKMHIIVGRLMHL